MRGIEKGNLVRRGRTGGLVRRTIGRVSTGNVFVMGGDRVSGQAPRVWDGKRLDRVS